MAVTNHLMVIAALAALSCCAKENRTQPSGNDEACNDASQDQVLPSMYFVFEHEFFTQEYNDTCSTGWARQTVCSMEQDTPKLTDCDIGPENGLLESSEYFYKLKCNEKCAYQLRWLAFAFGEDFVLETVKLYYYCTPRGSHLEVDLLHQREGSRYTHLSSVNMTCHDENYSSELSMDIPKNNQHRNIFYGSRVAIALTMPPYVILLLSEVQFFKDAKEDVSPKTLQECCSTTARPVTQSLDDGSATVTTIHSPTPDISTHSTTPVNTASGEHGAVTLRAFVGALVGVLVISTTATVVAICTTAVVYSCCNGRRDRIQAQDAVNEPPVEISSLEVFSNSAYEVLTNQTLLTLDSSHQQQYKDIIENTDYVNRLATVDATLTQAEPIYEHID